MNALLRPVSAPSAPPVAYAEPDALDDLTAEAAARGRRDILGPDPVLDLRVQGRGAQPGANDLDLAPGNLRGAAMDLPAPSPASPTATLIPRGMPSGRTLSAVPAMRRNALLPDPSSSPSTAELNDMSLALAQGRPVADSPVAQRLSGVMGISRPNALLAAAVPNEGVMREALPALPALSQPGPMAAPGGAIAGSSAVPMGQPDPIAAQSGAQPTPTRDRDAMIRDSMERRADLADAVLRAPPEARQAVYTGLISYQQGRGLFMEAPGQVPDEAALRQLAANRPQAGGQAAQQAAAAAVQPPSSRDVLPVAQTQGQDAYPMATPRAAAALATAPSTIPPLPTVPPGTRPVLQGGRPQPFAGNPGYILGRAPDGSDVPIPGPAVIEDHRRRTMEEQRRDADQRRADERERLANEREGRTARQSDREFEFREREARLREQEMRDRRTGQEGESRDRRLTTVTQQEAPELRVIGSASGVLANGQRLMGLIDRGEMRFGPLAEAGAQTRRFFDSSDQQDLNRADLRRHVQQSVEAILTAATGPQTDQDARRAADQILSNLTDREQVRRGLEALNGAQERARSIAMTRIQNRRRELGLPEADLRGFTDVRPNVQDAPRGGGGASAPAAAVEHLRANPSLRAEFDAKYGSGAAARALGQ